MLLPSDDKSMAGTLYDTINVWDVAGSVSFPIKTFVEYAGYIKSPAF